MSTGFQHVTSFPTICRKNTPCRPKISTLSPIWSSSSPFLAVESGKQGHGERKLSKTSSRKKKKKTAEMGHINHPYWKFMLGFTTFFLPPSFWYASIACYQPSHCSISSLWLNQSMDCFKGPSTGTTHIYEKNHGKPTVSPIFCGKNHGKPTVSCRFIPLNRSIEPETTTRSSLRSSSSPSDT